jgi:hypothetical protein
MAAAPPAPVVPDQVAQPAQLEASAGGPVLAAGPFEAHLRAAAEAGAAGAAAQEAAVAGGQAEGEAPAPVLGTAASDPQPERARSRSELLRPHSSSGLEALASRPEEAAPAAAMVPLGIPAVEHAYAVPGPGTGSGQEEAVQAAGQQAAQQHAPAESNGGHGS